MVHTRRDLLMISAAGGIAATVGLHASRASAQEKIQAKAGQAVARAYPYTAGIEDLIRLTNQGAGGRVAIQFFPDAQLGNERDLFEGLRLGTVQIAVGGHGRAGGICPRGPAPLVKQAENIAGGGAIHVSRVRPRACRSAQAVS